MGKFMKRHGSAILTCLGGIGLIVTAVLTAKAAPRAVKQVEEAKEEKGEEFTKLDAVKAAAPEYIPAVLAGASTLACVFGASMLNKRQQASLASAYAIVDQSYKKYRGKLKELYGEEANEKIMDAITAEQAHDVYPYTQGLFENTCLYLDEDICSKRMLFYEPCGGRLFESSLEQVMSAEYHINRNYVMTGSVSLNDFYEFLGLEATDYGEQVGWAPFTDEMLWIDFNHRKTTVDGKECYVIEMAFEPTVEAAEYF